MNHDDYMLSDEWYKRRLVPLDDCGHIWLVLASIEMAYANEVLSNSHKDRWHGAINDEQHTAVAREHDQFAERYSIAMRYRDR